MRRGGRGFQASSRFIPTPVGNAFTIGSRRRSRSVHPHARGECVTGSFSSLPSAGSSPRPWGMRQDRKARIGRGRFIPTPVGNARMIIPTFSAWPVHPHARGECRCRQSSHPRRGGSSPRPWGMLLEKFGEPGYLRFIPTPVGNAARCGSGWHPGPVHPHARGECSWRRGTGLGCYGSSPRPWGMRQKRRGQVKRTRFIPTPVGNADRQGSPSCQYSVHPHARGECHYFLLAITTIGGSSPRPWGMPDKAPGESISMRFIPTPVGNANISTTRLHALPVHPHARGECAVQDNPIASPNGSSPRPWGMQILYRHEDGCQRFIPTPVGNASIPHNNILGIAVHPHARGECHRDVVAAPICVGSSPRPWGMPTIKWHGEIIERFIPTPVGNAKRRRCKWPNKPVHPHARGECPPLMTWPAR